MNITKENLKEAIATWAVVTGVEVGNVDEYAEECSEYLWGVLKEETRSKT